MHAGRSRASMATWWRSPALAKEAEDRLAASGLPSGCLRAAPGGNLWQHIDKFQWDQSRISTNNQLSAVWVPGRAWSRFPLKPKPNALTSWLWATLSEVSGCECLARWSGCFLRIALDPFQETGCRWLVKVESCFCGVLRFGWFTHQLVCLDCVRFGRVGLDWLSVWCGWMDGCWDSYFGDWLHRWLANGGCWGALLWARWARICANSELLLGLGLVSIRYPGSTFWF